MEGLVGFTLFQNVYGACVQLHFPFTRLFDFEEFLHARALLKHMTDGERHLVECPGELLKLVAGTGIFYLSAQVAFADGLDCDGDIIDWPEEVSCQINYN